MTFSAEFKRYFKAGFIFLVASVIIMFFTPRNGNFEYEFSKGKIWTYDDLYAPFDFSVYKTENELLEERKIVNETASKYYNIDTLTGKAVLSSLREELFADAGREIL